MYKLVHTRLHAIVLALLFTLGIVGCSSSPDEEEMRQLNDLKAEISSLEQQISAKEKEKAEVDKQVAEKNSRLEMCRADQDAVKKGAVK